MRRRPWLDFVLLVAVNGMWAAQYAAYKTASRQMGPLTVSAWTFLVAALVLLPFRRVGAAKSLSRAPWSRRDVFGFLLLSTAGLVPASVLLAWGTSRSTASNAALIYLTVPVLTALLAALLLGERMTRLRWLSLALALAGVCVLSEFDFRHSDLAGGRFLAGNALVLLACASSSFYNVYSKRLLARHAPVDVLVFGYLLAAALITPLLGLEQFSPAAILRYSIQTWFAVLVLSAMSWGLAMVLWMFLLRRLAVSQVSISIYLLPFLGVLISSVTLGESITAAMLAGGLLTVVGTALATAAGSSAS